MTTVTIDQRRRIEEIIGLQRNRDSQDRVRCYHALSPTHECSAVLAAANNSDADEMVDNIFRSSRLNSNGQFGRSEPPGQELLIWLEQLARLELCSTHCTQVVMTKAVVKWLAIMVARSDVFHASTEFREWACRFCSLSARLSPLFEPPQAPIQLVLQIFWLQDIFRHVVKLDGPIVLGSLVEDVRIGIEEIVQINCNDADMMSGLIEILLADITDSGQRAGHSQARDQNLSSPSVEISSTSRTTASSTARGDNNDDNIQNLAPPSTTHEDSDQDCPICLTILDDQNSTQCDTCHYDFHAECMTIWSVEQLTRGSYVTCPCCRSEWEE